MAAPTYTGENSANSKTTGTQLVVPAGTTDFDKGDTLICFLGMDGVSDAVTFTPSTGAGIATVGSMVTDANVLSLGLREMLVRWPITNAGTCPAVTIDHPSIDARAALTGIVKSGAAIGSNFVASDASADDISPVTTTSGNRDCLMLVFLANEGPNGDTITDNSATLEPDWTGGGGNTFTSGTSGAGAASNISIGTKKWTRDGISSDSFYLYRNSTPLFVLATTRDFLLASLVFESPPPVLPLRSRVHTRQAVSRASVI